MQMVRAATERAYLRALDELLAGAVTHACRVDPSAASDRWQGLHIDRATASALARREGLLAGFHADFRPVARAAREDAAMALLAELYRLSDLAIAVLSLTVATEVDARYGRILGFLHDDVTRRLPTPALLGDLFSGDDVSREQIRLVVAPGSTLHAQHLITVEQAPNETTQTALIRLDPQIRQLLLDESGVDGRLTGFCLLRSGRLSIDALPVEPEIAETLRAAADALRRPATTPLRLALVGPAGCGQEQAVEALAAAANRPILEIDVRSLAAEPGDVRLLLQIARREGLLANALVHIVHADVLDAEPHGHVRLLLEEELARFGPAIVLDQPSPAWLAVADRIGFAPLRFEPPSTAMRRRIWCERAAEHGVALADSGATLLAKRFRLTGQQIDRAAARAAMSLRARSAREASPAEALDACLAAALGQGGHHLSRLAKRIVPRYTWDDMVMTAHVDTQLRELCQRVELGATVLEQWRFSEKLALGRGISALFAGPSGTGKTMAAEVVAHELGIDLFKIDLATVVSKYIGETEQNLDRIFRAAQDVNGILLFDEADALFGKRSEVHDSHDRYANLEISYLLQKMEEFEGVAILSTNLQKNLDDAFTRRLAFIVHFPFPEAAERCRIWEVVWPDAVPREPGLRFERLAERCKLSGGNIKSAALSAAYFAAAEDGAVAIRHIVRAVGREYEKLGRPLKSDEVAAMLYQEGGA
jgi:hypothetical protein